MGKHNAVRALPGRLSPRQVALECGHTTYLGSACNKCGTTEKYSKHGTCVKCGKANTKARVVAGDFKKYRGRNYNKAISQPNPSYPAGPVTYLIVQDVGRFGKIGTTTGAAVDKRLATLQCGNPYRLRVAVVIKGDCERELHRRFDGLRVAPTSEWFHITPELIAEFQRRSGAIAA